jgi:hypothetical protein
MRSRHLSVYLFLILASLQSACSDCKDCFKGLGASLNKNGVYICYGEDTTVEVCTGVRVYACNSKNVARTAKIQNEWQGFPSSTTYQSITVPANAQIDNKTAPFLGISEGWDKGLCVNRNFTVLSAD